MNEELDKIRDLIELWPSTLDEARQIDGVECVSWNKYTLEPNTFRLKSGGRYDYTRKEIMRL